MNVGYLAYNTQKAPFDNVKVRKALNHAINKQAIIDTVFQGAGKPAKNPIPPTIWSYNDAVVDDAYDLDLAKKLLAEAGYPNGFEMKLWAMPVQRPYNPNARRMAEVMQADWAKIGVKAEIVSYEWGESISSVPRMSIVMALSCLVGPAITVIRTTSWPYCSVVMARGWFPTVHNGAISHLKI